MADPSLAIAVKAPPMATALGPILADKNLAAIVPALSTGKANDNNKKYETIKRILFILLWPFFQFFRQPQVLLYDKHIFRKLLLNYLL